MLDRFLTQRFANAYPRWTKARRDPSSVAQRFYSPLAEMLANEYAILKKQSHEFSLHRDWIPAGALAYVQLEVADFFPVDETADGDTEYSYPTSVTIDLGAGPEACRRLQEADDLFIQLPDRLESETVIPVSAWEVYDSLVGSTLPIDYPSRLEVRVSDSTEYYLTGRGEFSSGRYFVDIKGYDIHGFEITDRVEVRDDGVYRTKEFFSELIEVRSHGFNGRVQLFIASALQGINDPYFLGADEDNEGPLYHELEISGGRGVLSSKIDREIYGAAYRRGGEVLELEDTEVWATVIRDNGGAEIVPADLAFDWNVGMVVVLDTAGYVHWYDLGRTAFTEMSDMASLTLVNYLEVQPLTSWAVLDTSLTLFTRFQRPYIIISKVRIKRVNPLGTVTYLQGDRVTWNATSYWHQYSPDGTNTEPTESWKDFKFESLMDVVGEWEFYCETNSNNDITVSGTKVSVPAANALTSLNTEVADIVGETPERLFFDNEGRLSVGTVEGNLHPMRSVYLNYWPDPENQALWFVPYVDLTPAAIGDVVVTY